MMTSLSLLSPGLSLADREPARHVSRPTAARAAIGATVLRVAAQLLPAQLGDYLVLMTILPLSSLLPGWSARPLDRLSSLLSARLFLPPHLAGRAAVGGMMLSTVVMSLGVASLGFPA